MLLRMTTLGRRSMSDYSVIHRAAYDGDIPRLVAVDYEYEQVLHRLDEQVLVKELGHPRPYLVVMPLWFRGNLVQYAIPLRSSMPHSMSPSCCFRLGEYQEGWRFPGLQFSKMIPITGSVIHPYKILEGSPLSTEQETICRFYDLIAAAAQRYLDEYDISAGYWTRTDLDLLADAVSHRFEVGRAS